MNFVNFQFLLQRFTSCYPLIVTSDAWSWESAEALCVRHKANLWSINSHEQWRDIFHGLTELFRRYVKYLFIGLRQGKVHHVIEREEGREGRKEGGREGGRKERGRDVGSVEGGMEVGRVEGGR